MLLKKKTHITQTKNMAKPVSITSNELVGVIHKIIIDKFNEANKMGYLNENDMEEMFVKLGLTEKVTQDIKNEKKVCQKKCCDKECKENDMDGIKFISYKKHPKKPSVNLPFCNVIVKEWCYGIKLNHGLYTQCHLKKVKGGEYCKTCLKQSKKNKNNLPNSGDIRNRKYNMNYIAPNRKKQKPYSDIVKKQNIDIKFAHREAKKLNWTIPENELDNIRPVKVSSVVSDTSDEEDVEIIDSKIKKASKEFEEEEKKEDSSNDDNIDIENCSFSAEELSDGEDDSNDDKFKHLEVKIIKGNKYYFDEEGKSNIKNKDGDIIKNVLLDFEEGIPVGTYNEGKIKPIDF